MEELLNKLIEKGWKPFGEGCHRSPYKRVSVHKNYNKERTYVLFYSNNHSHWKVLRQVVSKESGLWQFVCEMSAYNNYNKEKGKVLTWKKFEDDKYQINGYSNGGGYIQDYEYRLIESSLKDENELEDFLLSNIKVEGL